MDRESYKMIEADPSGQTYAFPGKFAVYEYGIYPPSSVLAGQQRRSFLGLFDTALEAIRAHPDAEIA